jgi:hypothetical protein
LSRQQLEQIGETQKPPAGQIQPIPRNLKKHRNKDYEKIDAPYFLKNCDSFRLIFEKDLALVVLETTRQRLSALQSQEKKVASRQQEPKQDSTQVQLHPRLQVHESRQTASSSKLQHMRPKEAMLHVPQEGQHR